MKLVIVESPAKAATIKRFLGPNYVVVASYGHIRDLPGSASEIPKAIREKPWANLGVDTENEFAPVYVVSKESKKRIDGIKKLLRDSDELLLATDEDREGESISWHLIETLKPKIPVKRITFHEITESAISEALENPRDIDTQLVRAQESRRILDRLFGYSLSPVLWKKVRTKLSAGRVQSVALRLVVEREEERQAFKCAEYWDVEAEIRKDGTEFTSRLISVSGKKIAAGKDFNATTGVVKDGADVLVLSETEAAKIAEFSSKSLPWVVGSVEKKRTRQKPAPPFITSTLQQAAGSRLNMSTSRTMRVAQRLYEGIDLGGSDRQGLITYMRTDSVVLSNKALGEIGSFVKGTFGEEYYDGPRQYKTKSRSAQEAHEAIRPADVALTPESMARYLDKDELNLYRLIWNRAVASQMKDAVLDKVSVEFKVDTSDEQYIYRSTGSTVAFDGHLRVYGNGGKETILPELNEGDRIGESGSIDMSIKPLKHETTPPPRFTEATLVRRLEEEGIGRPSTYAPTISTIQQREYVIKKSGALVPTYVGMAVTHLLREHFEHYIDVGFTARMEDQLDDIAEGEANWVEFLDKFYNGNGESGEGLLKRIEDELPKIEYPLIPVGTDLGTGKPINVRIGRNSVYIQLGEGGDGSTATVSADLLIDELTADKARELLEERSRTTEPIGTDPETGKNVFKLVGPYGPYVQLGEVEGKKKPKRVPVPKGRTLDDVDLEFALKLLNLPREVGKDPESGVSVIAGIGRYGPFIERDGTFRSLESADDIFTITLEQAVALLNEKPKRRSNAELRTIGKHPESGDEIKIKEGRYGPYVTDGKVNAGVPRGRDPLTVELQEAVSMLAEAASKKASKKTTKKTTRKSTRTSTKTTAKKAAKKTTTKTTRKPRKSD